MVKSTLLTQPSVEEFQRRVYAVYAEQKRIFPWRLTRDPYRILVSEIMLQQTQAGKRTIQKYRAFLKAYPTVRRLARASLRDVLVLWQGLGYNRRAKALRDTAFLLTRDYRGRIPPCAQELMKFPGVGVYTSVAICVFAFNQPEVLLETNIRTVYIHEFFQSRRKVSDKELLPLIRSTLDTKHPREWYFALMDYGVLLKKKDRALNKRSAHYGKQSAFIDSDRHVRGSVVRVLTRGPSSINELTKETSFPKERVRKQVGALIKEGFVMRTRGKILLAS